MGYRWKRRLAVIICTAGMLLWSFAGLGAAVALAAEEALSLTVICRVNEVKLSDMTWNIYQVGQRLREDTYTLEGAFADYPVSMENLTDTTLQSAANTLENYAILDNLTPLATSVTDETGALTLTGLSKGLYLLTGTPLWIGNTKYTASASLVYLEETSDEVDFTLYAKFHLTNAYNSTRVPYTVEKVWQNDDTQPEDRTAEIQVGIYRDGELVEQVTLSEENNWRYRWSGLDSADWRVKEIDVPTNYSVVYHSSETELLIVNTHSDSSTTTGTTDQTDGSTTTTTTATGTATQTEETTALTEGSSSAQSSTTASGSSTSTKLPQTGQLWWPVPLFLAGGMICIVIGWRMGRKK